MGETLWEATGENPRRLSMRTAGSTHLQAGWVDARRKVCSCAPQAHTHSGAAASFLEAKVETNANQRQVEKLSHVHMH